MQLTKFQKYSLFLFITAIVLFGGYKAQPWIAQRFGSGKIDTAAAVRPSPSVDARPATYLACLKSIPANAQGQIDAQNLVGCFWVGTVGNSPKFQECMNKSPAKDMNLQVFALCYNLLTEK